MATQSPFSSRRVVVRFLLLLLYIGSLLSVSPATKAQQQTDLESAASGIAKKLLKEKRTRILVTDFYGPAIPVVSELGRDLASAFSTALAKTNPNFVLLPRTGMQAQVPILFSNVFMVQNPQERPVLPEAYAEYMVAGALSRLVSADTIVTGRIKTHSNGIRLELHVYLPWVPTVPSATNTPGSDVQEPWTHEARVDIPLTTESRARLDQIVFESPKGKVALVAGTVSADESFLKSECLDCLPIPLDGGFVLELSLRIQPNGNVSIASAKLQPDGTDPNDQSDQAKEKLADSIIGTVSKWRFKPFSSSNGQTAELYRLLVVDGVHRTVELLMPVGAGSRKSKQVRDVPSLP